MKGSSIKKLISYLLVFSLVVSISTNIAFNSSLSNISTVQAANTQVQSNEYFKSKLTNPNLINYYDFLSEDPTKWFDGTEKDLVYTINYESLGVSDSVSDNDIHKEIFGSNDWFDKLKYSVMRDHPEIFWIDWTKLSLEYQRDTTAKTVTYKISPFGSDTIYHKTYENMPDAQATIQKHYQDLMAKAKTIVEPTKSMTSNYDKLMYLNRWIVTNNKYASDTAIGTLDNRRTAYSSIMSNNDESTGPVCVGYSYGYQLLCNLAGLQSVIVYGKIYNDPNDNIGTQHAWNRVQGDDGKWYDVDTTWNDYNDVEKFIKGYFMVGYNTNTINPITNNIYKNNHKDDGADYPTLSNERYVVQNSDKEAFVNDTVYDTIENAFMNAKDNDTIILNGDFTGDIQIENTIVIDKNINLDINGKTLKISSANVEPVFTIKQGATLTINDSKVTPDSTIATMTNYIGQTGMGKVIDNNGTCVINSGKLYRRGGLGGIVSPNSYTVGNSSKVLVETSNVVAVIPVSMSKIDVINQPIKTTYTYGEQFNPQGLRIRVTYSDGTTKDIDYDTNDSGFSFTPSLTENISVSTTNVTVNYTDGNSVVSSQIPVTVNKATPNIQKNPTASSIKKGQSLKESILSDGDASVDGTFAWKNPDEIPTATGDHIVVFTPNDTENYNTVELQVSVQVVEENPTITAPTPIENLVYNANPQALVNTGSTNVGELQYSLSKTGKYSIDIPTATNAGTYQVWYKVVDSLGNELVAPASVEVQIAKANPNIGTVSATIAENDTSATNVVLSRTDDTVAGTLALEDTSVTLQYGENELDWKFTANDTNNYNSINGKVIVTVTDTIAPTAEVTIGKNTWKEFLNNITFGLFFKETQTVKATAEDNLSGIETIEYYESNKALTFDEVEKLTNVWKEMSKDGVNITAQDAKKLVYYIKVTDKAKNTTYISTDGIVFDTVAPVISGIENNKTYCNPVEVTVTDVNLKSVTVNDKQVTLIDNKFTVTSKNTPQTIVATDKAGNTTEYTITVNDNHMLTYTAQGNVIKEECVYGDHHETATITAGDAVYTGSDIKTAKVEYSPNWKGGDLTVSYENNINAGTAIAKITKDNATATVEFLIEKANQKAPSNVIGVDESIDGKNDGSITNVTADMEYSTDKTDWVAVEGNKIENLQDGTYYVRYKETENKKASDEVEITINSGKKLVVDFVVDGQVTQTQKVSWNSDVELPEIPSKEGYDKVKPYWDNDGKNITKDTTITAVYTINTYNVSLPKDTLGYKITSDKEVVNWNDSVTLTFKLIDGYKLSDDFKVQINGKDIDLTNGKYKVSNVKEDIIITVSGVIGLYETENTQAVKDITVDNVKLTDKDKLNKALNDLKHSLQYADNYTEKEVDFINNSINRIENALQSISNVEKVEDILTNLPTSVKPDDVITKKEIVNAKEAYDSLTDYEKSLLSQENVDKLNSLLKAMNNYEIIEGNNSKWQSESNKDLTIKANGSVDLFTGIKIDGKEVSKDNYTVKSGSTVVTLKSEYLKTLTIGKHTITFVYQDGEVSGQFEVTKNNSNNSNNSNGSTDQTKPSDNNNNQNTNNNSNTSEKGNSNIANTKDDFNISVLFVLMSVLSLGVFLKKKQNSKK